MVNKKVSKNVLDYDPLAWLDEGSEEPQQGVEETPEELIESEVETTVSGTQNLGYGFFTDDEDASEETPEALITTQKEQKASETEQVSEAYGFFDDDFSPSSAPTAQSDEASGIIDLGTDLTIRSVANCKSLISERLHQGFDIRLDANQLQKIDSAGLQLLFSLDKTLKKTSQFIHWVNSNAMINEAARLAGLPELFQVKDDDSAFGFFDDEAVADNSVQEESAYGFF